LRADVLFIRAQSAIRADAPPSTQVLGDTDRSLRRCPQRAGFDHCALRAPTGFSVRIKIIRTENPVMDETNDSATFLLRSLNSAYV